MLGGGGGFCDVSILEVATTFASAFPFLTEPEADGNLCVVGGLAGEGDHFVLRFAQDLRDGFALTKCSAAHAGVEFVDERAVLMVVAHSFALASCRSLSVLPSFVFQSTRPLAARPCTTPAAVDGDGKT